MRNQLNILKGAVLSAVIIACALLTASTAIAQQIPQVLPYQGYLARANGNAVEGTVDIVFNLYAGSQDEEPLWSETHENVIVQDGVFYVYLGSELDLLEYFGDGTTKYLGISVNGDPEAEPRQSIGSVPYALLAGNALALEGYGADYFASQQDIENFVTNQELANILNDYATQQDIANFITEGDVTELLENYVTEADIANFITNQDLTEALENYVTEGDLNQYVTVDQLENFVQEGDLNNYVTLNELNNYVTQQELNNYVTNVDLDEYVTNQELTTALNNYVTVTQHTTDVTNLQNQINNLQNQINNINVNGNGGGTGYILGQTTATTDGSVTFNGLTGWEATNAMCQAHFANEPTAHICNDNEAQLAFSVQSYGNGLQFNVEAWIAGLGSQGNNANNTTNNNCQNMLYHSGHIGTGATSIFFNNTNPAGNNTAVAGDIINVKYSQACGTARRILCCR